MRLDGRNGFFPGFGSHRNRGLVLSMRDGPLVREKYTNDFSVYKSAGLKYRKPHTFVRDAGISGNVYFPPDNLENFISRGSISLAFRTWSPLYVRIGYTVDYTKSPEISTWKIFNTDFTTALNFDFF